MVLSCLIILLGTLAPAERITRARTCYAALDFDCTHAELEQARASWESLDPEQRLQVLRLSAELTMATGDDPAAARALRELLAVEPDFQPTDRWPPLWREVLERVRSDLPDRRAPTLKFSPPSSLPAGAATRLVAEVREDRALRRVELVLSGPEPRRLAMQQEASSWSVVLPGALVRPGLSFAIEAEDAAGNLGTTPAHGVQVQLPPPAPEPLWSSPWLWGGIALGLGAVLTTTVLLSSEEDEPAARGTLTPRWPE